MAPDSEVASSNPVRNEIPSHLHILSHFLNTGYESRRQLSIAKNLSCKNLVPQSISKINKVNHTNPEIFPDNYKVFSRDRKTGKRGGVFILIEKKFKSFDTDEIITDQDCEMMWTQMSVVGVSKLYIGAFHRPTNMVQPEYMSTAC